jgi:hypothetical protein
MQPLKGNPPSKSSSSPIFATGIGDWASHGMDEGWTMYFFAEVVSTSNFCLFSKEKHIFISCNESI